MYLDITRDSVCAGDDIEDHAINICINENIKYMELFNKLIKEKYFPNVLGSDVVWVLCHGINEYVVWITKDNKLINNFIDEEDKIIFNKIDDKITFKYYSSPMKRAEYIYKIFSGKKFHIWHENYMNEYEYYKISEETEKKWLEEINIK
jgi:hypothetical protein